MSNFKHTPGPWVIRAGQVYANRPHPVAPKAYNEETIFSLTRSPEEREANARLIAAAPELLEALQGIIEIGKRDMSNPKYDIYFEEAAAAIAKATGGKDE